MSSKHSPLVIGGDALLIFVVLTAIVLTVFYEVSKPIKAGPRKSWLTLLSWLVVAILVYAGYSFLYIENVKLKWLLFIVTVFAVTLTVFLVALNKSQSTYTRAIGGVNSLLMTILLLLLVRNFYSDHISSK